MRKEAFDRITAELEQGYYWILTDYGSWIIAEWVPRVQIPGEPYSPGGFYSHTVGNGFVSVRQEDVYMIQPQRLKSPNEKL